MNQKLFDRALDGSASVTETAFGRGAELSLPGLLLRVEDVGKKLHSAGYGDVDFTASLIDGHMAQGSIINTPWGYGEIVAPVAAPRCSWEISEGDQSVDLRVDGEIRAKITVWTDHKTKDNPRWMVADPAGGGIATFEETFTAACAAATRHAGVALPPLADVLSAYGEEYVDKPVVAEAAEQNHGNDDLVDRLGKMLAEIIDAALLTVHDIEGGAPRELRLASFQPDLGRRAAELLEEAGY